MITASKLSSVPAVNPTLTAFDTNGNEIDNASEQADLALVPGYVPAPRITSVSPTIGPASGGTSVTITGTGFTGATAVDFGSAPAASFAVNSNTSVSAVTPVTGTATADSGGSFTCSGSVPSGSTAGALGAHKIKAKETSSLSKATTSFTLT